jgi:hypothetical protein
VRRFFIRRRLHTLDRRTINHTFSASSLFFSCFLFLGKLCQTVTRRRSRWRTYRKVLDVIVHLNFSLAVDQISASVNGLFSSRNCKIGVTLWSISSCRRAEGRSRDPMRFRSAAHFFAWFRMIPRPAPSSLPMTANGTEGITLLAKGQTRIKRVVTQ